MLCCTAASLHHLQHVAPLHCCIITCCTAALLHHHMLHRCTVASFATCCTAALLHHLVVALLQRIAELSAAAGVRAYVYVYAHFDRQCEVSLEVGSTAPNRTTHGTPNPAQSDVTDDLILSARSAVGLQRRVTSAD
jgi:hypothetical protein